MCAPSNNFDDLQRFHPPGRGIWTTDNEGAGPGSDFTPGSRYTGDFGGTSSATPTVAGVCGLVLSQNPNLSAKQVVAIIEDTASQDLIIASDTPVNVPGDFDGDGFSFWFGHGKIDAAAAVTQAGQELHELETVQESATDLPLVIPDTGQIVESQLAFSQPGTIADLRIHVRITHSYIGDLIIDLITPDGVGINLRNHEGGGQQNLDHTFSMSETPALQPLLGDPLAGTWTLRVVDTWRWDTGQLESWAMAAKLADAPIPAQPPTPTSRGKRRTKKPAYAGTRS